MSQAPKNSRGRIRLYDNISSKGLDLLKEYEVGREEISRPHAIIVRDSTIWVGDYPGLDLVVRAGAGVDKIDVPEATQRGIVVSNTADANASSVAELVFNMLGDYLRPLEKGRMFVLEHASENADALTSIVKNGKSQFEGRELYGRTLGIVGMGHIGKRVAKVARGYGMHVIGYDLEKSSIKDFQWANTMEDVFRKADIVTVHVPHKKGVDKKLIGKDVLALMKQGSVLINTARGELVDNEAILEALHTPEAPLSAYLTDFPMPGIIGVEGIMCTPHIGASTIEAKDRCAIAAAQQVRAFIEYGSIINSLNMPNVTLPLQDTTRTRLVIINNNTAGMIGKITDTVGKWGHNIQDMINKSRGRRGCNLIDFDGDVPDTVIGEVRKMAGVVRVRAIRFPKAS